MKRKTSRIPDPPGLSVEEQREVIEELEARARRLEGTAAYKRVLARTMTTEATRRGYASAANRDLLMAGVYKSAASLVRYGVPIAEEWEAS